MRSWRPRSSPRSGACGAWPGWRSGSPYPAGSGSGTGARERPRQAFVLLAQLDGELEATPLTLDEIEDHLGVLPVVPSLDERVAAAIVGIPAARGKPPRGATTGPSRGKLP